MPSESQKNPWKEQRQPRINSDPPDRTRRKKEVVPFFLTFFILLVVWILLSGRFDLFHLSFGILSCAIVAVYAGSFLFPSPDLKVLPALWIRFIRYLPWLIYQIFVANVHLLYLSFHPRMMDLIDPQMAVLKSRLKTDLALWTLANSITLTPGTITVHATTFGDVTFHIIDVESGKSLPWIMDAKIAEIFGE